MAAGSFVPNESRNSPRFVPQENLSIFLASDKASVVRGDVKDLSEVGARVLTHEVMDQGDAVTVDVRDGYSYLFRAEGKVVWRTDTESRRDSRVCAHGIFFTALSPFSRKLIRRLSGHHGTGDAATGFDEDLEALFPASAALDDVFDLLSDPIFERALCDEAAEGAELSGNLGYFSNTDVLQMLEAARATGVLHVEGDYPGQIHLQDGRICGCFSEGLDEHEAAFRLIVSDRGRFRFIPSAVRSNLLNSRTTTQLLLEAQLRRDNGRTDSVRDQRFAT